MAEEKKYTFRCTVCGWEVTVDTPELPEDFLRGLRRRPRPVRARRGVARTERAASGGDLLREVAPSCCRPTFFSAE